MSGWAAAGLTTGTTLSPFTHILTAGERKQKRGADGQEGAASFTTFTHKHLTSGLTAADVSVTTDFSLSGKSRFLSFDFLLTCRNVDSSIMGDFLHV